MTTLAAPIVIMLAAAYFIALAVVALLMPARARRFLLGFVASGPLHYLEMLLRLAVGTALVVQAPRMAFEPVFQAFGWLLLVTTAGLLLLPWRWHRQFAQQSVPRALPYLGLIGVSSLALGGFMIYALVRGAAA